MLVPPQIVDRPGANGTPSGVCELSGSASVGEGPYALVMGRYYARQQIAELAKAFDLLTRTDAPKKFENIVAEVAMLRSQAETYRDEIAAGNAERSGLQAELSAATKERDTLAAELAKTKTFAELADEFLNPTKTRSAA